MTTPLYHASVSVITGLAFPIGSSMYFAPVGDAQVYRVVDQMPLTITAQVEPAMARFLAEVVVAPRLLALAGGEA
jgi:hypothetical protein